MVFRGRHDARGLLLWKHSLGLRLPARGPRHFLSAPSMGPYLLKTGSELWAPSLKVVYDGVETAYEMGSTVE